MPEDVVLPAFEMDCRDWLVATPNDVGLPDELGGAPLLAVLSTAVFGPDEFRCASAVLTIGLLDDDDLLSCDEGAVAAAQLVHGDAGSICYLARCPDGDLALLAEFTGDGGDDPALRQRIDTLMASFRWAA
ncbi:MAG: hypothetical protein ABJB98_09990 [Actinomycetota bacterium]